jgi:endonuclease YncB( thermonuclease family)
MRYSRVSIGALVIVLALGAWQIFEQPQDSMLIGLGQAKDGDSLMVSGQELRLKGMDAPEFRQTCKISGASTPCGREAFLALRRWLARGPVHCVGHERDRYGRLLAICRVNGTDIGADLVRNGLAIAYGRYEAEEGEAKKAYRGIWSGTFERPQEYRARMRDVPREGAAPP